MRRIPYQAGIVLLFLLSLRADDKRKAAALYTKPAQSMDLDLDAVKVVNARQKCENWAIAAGLESMLKQENVALDQNFWVMRISGGELCIPEIPRAELLAEAVNREFVLESGRHVMLELRYLPGAPGNSDALIAGLKQQRLSLLLFRGHAYYLTGVTYDELIYRDGSRMFIITELRLANTFAQQPGTAFIKGRDEMDGIAGIISVGVTPAEVHW